MLDQLVKVWEDRKPRNSLRSLYFDSKNTIKDLGISLPPQLATAESMLSWPAKAVNSLAARSMFDGFVADGDTQDPFELLSVLSENSWDVELPQAQVSSLVHAVSFVSVTAGDVASGEPEVQVLARSARHGSALWDRRRRGVSAALAIADTDDRGEPTALVMYLPDVVILADKDLGSGVWRVDRRPNPVGRVLVTPLVFRPELDRPFGHSRISRAVMQLTDAAVRTFVRSEVGAEFYATPQRYILGADPDMFKGGDAAIWKATVSNMLGLTKDEDGDIPTIGQFAQMTMQPHLDQLRSIAQAFAAETNLPVSSLGVVQDQPVSAEAIYAAKEDLVMETNSANRVWGAALRTVAENIVLVRDGRDEVPDELKRLQCKWRNPASPSIVSASDAFVKQVSAIPWLAESEVALEVLGYDEATRTRLLADKARAEARDAMNGPGLAARAAAAEPRDVMNLSRPVVSDTPVEVERGDKQSGR